MEDDIKRDAATQLVTELMISIQNIVEAVSEPISVTIDSLEEDEEEGLHISKVFYPSLGGVSKH